MDATQTGGAGPSEPGITTVTGLPVTSVVKPKRVLIPGQFSVTPGVSRLADAAFDMSFEMPLPDLPDGSMIPMFKGSIKPTDKIPVLDRSQSPFGRRVGLSIDDFLDTSLVDSDPDTEGAPALIRGNGTIVEYSGKGDSAWTSPNGSFTTIARPGAVGDYIVTNQLGDKWIFDGSATQSKGVLKEIQAWTGEKTVFNRSGSDLNGDGVLNDLLSVQYISAGMMPMVMDSVTYTWTGPNITAITDLDNRVWTYEYGANNLLLSVTGPPNDSVVGLTPVERSKTIFTYVTGDPTYTLERIERRDETGTFSEKTSFAFDQWRNVTSITRESTTLGNRTWGFNSAESKMLNGQYLWVEPTAEGTPPEVLYTTGPEDTITLPNGDIIRREVDPFGNTLQERHTFSGGTKEVVTLFERNLHGQVRRQTGPSLTGQTAPILVTNFTYDGLRRLTNIAYPDATTEVWTYNAPGLSGPHQPDTFTNRVGHKATYGYTAGQRTSETVRTASNAFMYETATTWSGMMVMTQTLPSTTGGGQGSANRPAIKYVYDSRGRLIHTRRTSSSTLTGPPVSTDIWTSQGWNAQGNVSFVTSEYSNATLGPDQLPTGLGDTLKTEFLTTALGDVRQMTLPDPDGIGPLTRPVYRYALDALGRVLTAIDPGPETEAERTTTFDWNDFGELATVGLADPDGSGVGGGPLVGSLTTYAYDSIGMPVSIKTSAIGGAQVKAEFFQFNSRGELEFQSLPYGGPGVSASNANDRTSFQYDAFSRVTEQSVPSGLGAAVEFQVTKWAYDDSREFDDAAEIIEALDISTNVPTVELNNLSWKLAARRDCTPRQEAAAVKLAEQAVAADQKDGSYLNTLGVAQCRSGLLEECLTTLQRSEELSPGTSFVYDAYFISMAYQQLDRGDEARDWLNRAEKWHEANSPDDAELAMFREEAKVVISRSEDCE